MKTQGKERKFLVRIYYEVQETEVIAKSKEEAYDIAPIIPMVDDYEVKEIKWNLKDGKRNKKELRNLSKE